MNWLFGGGSTTKPVIYTGIQVQTSALNLPIPVGWGQNRISFNLLWYNNFQKHSASSKFGGKGGGGKSGQYTYSAAVILGLGEGVISSILNVYINQNTVTTLAKLGYTLFTGTAVQAPWGYVVTHYPTEALAYANTAYLANENCNLGSSATVPSMAFEAVMNLSGTMPGVPDANLADVIPDYLTNVRYGIGLKSSNIDSASNAFYKSYTQAQGLFFSPYLYQQEKVTDTIDRWAQLSNAFIFDSGTAIKFVPLGDEALSANGETYTPDTTIQYDLGPSDFAGLPVVQRKDPADCYNRTRVTINDRTNQYNSNPIEYRSQTLIDQFGFRDNADLQASEITLISVGQISATLYGKRAAFIRNTYNFKLTTRFIRLEPGDLVTLTHPLVQAMNKLPVRMLTAKLGKDGIDCTAEEYPGNLGTFTQTDQEVINNNPVDTMVDPGDVNTPAVTEPNSNFTKGIASLLVSASGGVNWGGCDVYVSLDGGVSYVFTGTIAGKGRQGLLTSNFPSHADPDNTDILSVDCTESQGELNPASHADADAFRTLSLISAQPTLGVLPQGELVAYGTVTPTGTYSSDLTYIRRGVYGTAISSHNIGDQFSLFDVSFADGSTAKITIPPAYVGTTIHLKFLSFNIFGNSLQDLSSVTDYQYVITGRGFGGGTGGIPTVPTGLTASVGSGQNAISWNPNPSTDNITAYKLYAGSGTGVSFGSCALIWQGLATNYVHTGLTSGAAFTYYLVAENVIGDSTPEGPVNATQGTFTYPFRLVGGTPGRKPLDAEELFNVPMVSGDTLPSGLTGSFIECEVAPTSNWTLTLKKNGTSIGTGTILAGNTTGTFTFSSPVVFATNDNWSAVAQTPQDATLSGLAFRFMGTRTQ